MDILFLTNLLPFPLDNGGKIKTYTTLTTLAHSGHKIDLVCFTETDDTMEKEEVQLLNLCRSIRQVYLKLTTAENMPYMMGVAARSLLSPYSFGTYKFISNDMKKTLAELCENNEYDCIYYDHLQLCVYEKFLTKRAQKAKRILDEHNCEATIMMRNAETTQNFFKKVFLKIESKKLKQFESNMLGKMDVNIVLSKSDYHELQKQRGEDFVHTIIPIGVQDRGIKHAEKRNDSALNILFVGTLTWEPNNQGLIWFLDNVIPELDKADYEYNFYIVGKNPSEEVVERAKVYNNIIVTGYVESVETYYNKCDCMVVPLFSGSGQRVKLIECFSKGMPAISTAIGAEGLEVCNHKNILIADTVPEFVLAIEEMYSEKFRESLGREARKCYEKNYSPEMIESKLNAVITNLE